MICSIRFLLLLCLFISYIIKTVSAFKKTADTTFQILYFSFGKYFPFLYFHSIIQFFIQIMLNLYFLSLYSLLIFSYLFFLVYFFKQFTFNRVPTNSVIYIAAEKPSSSCNIIHKIYLNGLKILRM